MGNMRLWSVHPKYLDRQGLLACWREALLAQAVLRGETRGYRSHPQLVRFQECADPVGELGTYLRGVYEEATSRGYSFDEAKIVQETASGLEVSDGQLAFEREHLAKKLVIRDPARAADLPDELEPHPMFAVVPGAIAPWERGE